MPPALKRRMTLISSRSWLSARLGTFLGMLVGDGEVLRLPGGAAHALAAHRLDRGLDRVGADDPHAVRQLQPRLRHPQADDRDDQDLGVVGVARFGIEHRERAVEPRAVERELGATPPRARK